VEPVEVFAEIAPGGMQYTVIVIVPERDGKNYASSHVMLDIAQGSFTAAVYRTALIVALEEFFGRRSANARHCQKEWPSERVDQAVAEMVPNRELN
jgi:hypothetical protein